MTIRPGDIFICRAFSKRRPVIVVSRDSLNKGDTVTIVPVTSARVMERASFPNFVSLQKGEGGLREASVAHADQIHVMDVDQLDQSPNGWVGALDASSMARIIAAIGYVIDADCRK